MTTNSRKKIRKSFAAMLEAALVGDGKLVQKVYDYQAYDFEGLSPVVVVSSSGTQREPITPRCTRPSFWLNVFVFVLYADETSGWTEADAENAIDDIDETIDAVVRANQVNNEWQAITQDDRSVTDSVVIGGLQYRMETIAFRVE
jgi:hypothetical protein